MRSTEIATWSPTSPERLRPGTDLEDACQDEGAQCDDEGEPDDNGFCDDDPTLIRRAVSTLVERPKSEIVAAPSGGLLIVALYRLSVALKDDGARMLPESAAALGSPADSTHADGAAQAKLSACPIPA